jgi:hypothetical protein
MKLARLWQPRKALFWQMVFFNVMSSVCGWAMRAFPLNTAGLLLLGFIALLNVLFGLAAMWLLMRDPPPAAPGRPDA